MTITSNLINLNQQMILLPTFYKDTGFNVEKFISKLGSSGDSIGRASTPNTFQYSYWPNE